MKVWRLGFVHVVVAAVLAGPAAAADPTGGPVPNAAGATAVALGPVETAIAGSIAQGGARIALEPDDLAGGRVFYQARGFAPVWVAAGGVTAKGRLALDTLLTADDWGLRSADLAIPAVPSGALTPQATADLELALTRSILMYARQARGSRIADPGKMLSEFIDRKPQLIPAQTVLTQMAASLTPDAYLRELNPQHVGFERLRQAYLKARAAQGLASDQRLPAGPILKPGMTHPQIAILRKRLGVAMPADGGADVYDAPLAAAVAAFQARSGMKLTDGIVGERTRVALNGDTDTKLPTLLANMEQWRWMPAQLGETHVSVNIPEFQMRLIQNGAVRHAERVVTGKLETSTPIFSDELQTVVFQPKWGVPDSIKINELLPRLQSGRGLRSGLRMALNGRDVDPWGVDWSRADITRYHVYQPSGDDNALGIVKFLFPNKHAVYMHDTPSKGLFNSQTRAFSHGCIRVRNPVRLAELVLGKDKGWSSDTVRELATEGPEDNGVKLDSKIPVHITYFTATVDETGRLETFPDVYGHEKRIRLALEGRADKIVKLSPLPVVARPIAIAEGGRGRREQPPVDFGEFGPPTGLGFAPPPAPPVAKWFQDAPAKKSTSRSSGGNSTNDLIMRQLLNGS